MVNVGSSFFRVYSLCSHICLYPNNSSSQINHSPFRGGPPGPTLLTSSFSLLQNRLMNLVNSFEGATPFSVVLLWIFICSDVFSANLRNDGESSNACFSLRRSSFANEFIFKVVLPEGAGGDRGARSSAAHAARRVAVVLWEEARNDREGQTPECLSTIWKEMYQRHRLEVRGDALV